MMTTVENSLYGNLVTVTPRKDYAIVTLNRPDKRNAMNYPAQAELWAVLANLRENHTKVIILTGAGDVSFCAGADIRDQTKPDTRLTASEPDTWFKTQEIIAKHPAIFIAAVNGFALGGGLTLVNNCELAVAAETATFGMPELGLGVFPALAGPSTIKRLLPKHVAEMIFTTKRINAATALQRGLVNEVVPVADLLPHCEALAIEIAAFNAIALDYSKRAFRELCDMSWPAGMEYGIRSTSVIAAARKRLEGN
jgi:enoyl-CoA hydratase/carnithine racemase